MSLSDGTIARDLPDETATALLGDDLAAALKPGDMVALSGELGAGKSTLARAIIRALARDPDLDVPSPTFTLVQEYEARIPVRHFDLYRLSSPEELEELGFSEAARSGIVLVEWPERAGHLIGADAIRVALEEKGTGRSATIEAPPDTLARIARSLSIRAFLDRSGSPGARRMHLLGDASSRAYETISCEGERPLILMDAPRRPDGPPIRDGLPYSRIARLAESVTPFVAVAKALRQAGFAAPEIFAQDLQAGLLLIENLGAGGFLDAAGGPVAERYRAAAGLLADLHAEKWPRNLPVDGARDYTLPDYDRAALAIETELLLDWYVPYATGAPASGTLRKSFAAAWDAAFDVLAKAESSLVLRDYHSPNLIWREELSGTDRLGIIDFQDAVIGPAAYDLASLAMDARVDISPALEAGTVAAYVAAREAQGAFNRENFEAAYAVTAAQRNTKILGIFVRLDVRDGKPHYLKHLPRIRDYLGRALRHPALAEVRKLYREAGILDGGRP